MCFRLPCYGIVIISMENDYKDVAYGGNLQGQAARGLVAGLAALHGKDYGQANQAMQQQTATGLTSRAAELLNHVNSLERKIYVVRENLFGQSCAESGTKQGIEPSTIEGMLADACFRIASLVGEMATINGKICS